jgi:hypothetical protein
MLPLLFRRSQMEDFTCAPFMTCEQELWMPGVFEAKLIDNDLATVTTLPTLERLQIAPREDIFCAGLKMVR